MLVLFVIWCQQHTDSTVHLIFDCCFEKEIWEMIGLQDKVKTEENDTFMTVLKQTFQSSTKD